MNNSNNNVPVVGSSNAVQPQNTNIAGGLSVAGNANGQNLALANQAAAEALGMIMVARNCPRNELDCIRKIEQACGRISFAENSQYELARGTSAISGPTVGLIRAIADYWGNIVSGSIITESTDYRTRGKSYAWDLETNRKVEVPFDVKHVRYHSGRNGKPGTTTPLTNPDDIRYLVNNYASRSERTAIERVIPTDIVQFALEKCAETQKVNVKTFNHENMLAAFAKYGVTKDDIEEFCQRKVETLKEYPSLVVRLRNTLKALEEGIGTAEDVFKTMRDRKEEKAANTDSTKKDSKKHGKTVEEFLADHPPVIEVPDEKSSDGELDLGDVK